ncbi:NAD(P)-binding domain-containing protein, partial [Enorma sp.]|uniref:NAD(P)-binding domain-containing protein n=1 Tax=Enorma sp. TaxID=1920692 RepID=UPI003AB54D00
LLKAGCAVMVSDLNQAAVDELVETGATSGSYAQIGAVCDIVFTMLPNGDIVQSVLFGEEGVASALTAGKIVCDMSSVTATQSTTCYEKLEVLGVGFMDAPVSGGEPGAVEGTLAIMCGGDADVFEALQPYFDIMGSSALLVGPSGSGSVCKLANQIIVNLNICAVSEALVLATKAGADPMKVYQAIRGGLAGSAVLDAKAPMMCARDFKPGGKISINHKDIKNVLATAHEIDVPLPFTAQLFEVQQALKAHGHMDDDHGGYVQYFEALADVEVKSDQ